MIRSKRRVDLEQKEKVRDNTRAMGRAENCGLRPFVCGHSLSLPPPWANEAAPLVPAVVAVVAVVVVVVAAHPTSVSGVPLLQIPTMRTVDQQNAKNPWNLAHCRRETVEVSIQHGLIPLSSTRPEQSERMAP